LKFENIVIGSSLSALAYAYLNNCKVFFTKPELPFRFGYLGVEEQPLDTPIDTKTLKTFDRTMEVGTPKQILWDRLYFVLSLNGQIPLSNLCHTLRYDGRSLVCSNEYSKIFEAEFERCYYFGDNNAEGIIRKKTLDEDTYLCYDHIAFNSGGKHEIDFIHTSDDFISEIWFYSSDRIDGNTPVRDACAVSKLTESQLRDFDYSETMARFKVLKIMKDNGMRGKQNGYTEKGTPRHYDFRTSSIRRETYRVRNELTTTSPDIEIKTDSEESLLRLLQNDDSARSTVLDVLNVNSP
jgi:hypothetical protein